LVSFEALITTKNFAITPWKIGIFGGEFEYAAGRLTCLDCQADTISACTLDFQLSGGQLRM
jgi:hypothetical protein